MGATKTGAVDVTSNGKAGSVARATARSQLCRLEPEYEGLRFYNAKTDPSDEAFFFALPRKLGPGVLVGYRIYPRFGNCRYT